jgi:hypothetical protein
MKHHNSSIKLASLLALGALALVQGCSDDDKNEKPDTNIPIDTGGKNSTGGKNGAAGKDSTDGGTGATGNDGGTGATGNEGGTGATGNDGGTGNEGGTGTVDPPKCDLPETGTNGCFNCPTDNVTAEWLNRCVGGLNYDNSFDNAARVPLLPANGKLPPFAN